MEKKKKVNLNKKLDSYYGTECYHVISPLLSLTDGTKALIGLLKDDFASGVLLNIIEKRLDKMKAYGIIFLKIIIKDNKISLLFYDDIPERGHRYNYKEELSLDRFSDEVDLEDCEVKTFIQSNVWALMSEY